MERIVVGLDGSKASDDALRWATTLGVSTGAAVTGVSAFRNPWSEMTPDDHDRLVAERKDLLANTWLAPAATAGVDIDAVVRDGDPRDVVLDAAVGAGADLVVLGRSGSGGSPGFLHIGSVVEHAAHHSSLPLAVIPVGASDAISRIVVGVDGSDQSLVALEWAGSVAKATDAEIIAVQVMEPYLEWTPANSPDNWRRSVERDLDAWAASLKEAGVSVTPVAHRDAHPADGLLGVAGARQADLVVVGARGLGGFSGLRAGGVALKILHRAGLPMVLVPVS